ncbi:hypothetical protein Q5P01_023045 [Channa striata]|uniref:Uncharacterized protein n=1 Tax=Channa striata TaxID=64152 RepID=A0AA88LQR9_CHASR|nr:hypothetical protein Q5P01_023045 [Channa striata]
MISRMVNILAAMIKPAVPTSYTTDMIMGNAKNRGHTTLLILQDHYKEGLDNLLKSLPAQLHPNWREAFQVATRWARRNLPRVKQGVFDHAEALVLSCVETGTAPGVVDEISVSGGGDCVDQQQGKRLGAVLPESQAQFLEEIVECSSGADSSVGRNGLPVGRQKGAGAVTCGTRRSSRVVDHTVAGVEGGSVAPPGGQPPGRVMCTVATMTDQRSVSASDWGGVGGEDTASQLPVQRSPKSRRVQRQSQAPAGQGAETGGCHSGEITGGADLLVGGQLVDLDLTPTLVPEVQRRVPLMHTAQVHGEGRSLSAELLDDLDSLFSQSQVGDHASTPKTGIFKPIRHIHTDRKLVDWALSVTKKWVIIGDCNLARIPRHGIPDLQIDSYPGETFRHAEAIMAKVTGQTMVEKLVLAFGLNSRAQKAKETAVKQLQAAVRMAKKQFPYAQIWIPLVNFSSSLPREEQETLMTLNAHISRNMPFIEPLGEMDFHTDEDHIHWTRPTAQAMLDHWVSSLNLTAP